MSVEPGRRRCWRGPAAPSPSGRPSGGQPGTAFSFTQGSHQYSSLKTMCPPPRLPTENYIFSSPSIDQYLLYHLPLYFTFCIYLTFLTSIFHILPLCVTFDPFLSAIFVFFSLIDITRYYRRKRGGGILSTLVNTSLVLPTMCHFSPRGISESFVLYHKIL